MVVQYEGVSEYTDTSVSTVVLPTKAIAKSCIKDYSFMAVACEGEWWVSEPIDRRSWIGQPVRITPVARAAAARLSAGVPDCRPARNS